MQARSTLSKCVMDSRYPIREVFADSLEWYLQEHSPSAEQISAANAISHCKTGELGYNVSVCDECGHTVTHSCSCRNRSCPNCQSVLKEVWIEKRRSEVLDAKYFHMVFTVPHQLNALFISNQRLLYDLLFSAASQTLLTLSRDKRYLGAEPGIIMVLHTWGQNLAYHPHVHCIISGAGLTRDRKLIKSDKSFFIPIKAAMKMFRGKFMSALKSYRSSGWLTIPDSCFDLTMPEGWQSFVDRLYSTDWCPYIKETFNGNGNAISYLGRYTHRVAISNGRITDLTDDTISFRYKDYKDGCTRKEMTLSHEEFIRRFLMHVLPRRFQKIRYFGFLANNAKKKKLRLLFELQGHQQFTARFSADMPKDMIISEILGIDVHMCPCCGKSSMRYLGRRYYLRS